MASEKNNYNFRRRNFDTMRTELDYQTFEQPIVGNNTVLGFEILKNRVNDVSIEDTSQLEESPSESIKDQQ